MKRFGASQAGRGRVSIRGRKKALRSLDRMLEECGGNGGRLEDALQDSFNRDPLRFFIEIVMPLLPKKARRAYDHDSVVQWQARSAGEGGQR